MLSQKSVSTALRSLKSQEPWSEFNRRGRVESETLFLSVSSAVAAAAAAGSTPGARTRSRRTSAGGPLWLRCAT